MQPTRQWVRLDDGLWHHDLQTATKMRLVLYRIPCCPTYYIALGPDQQPQLDEKGRETYGADWKWDVWGARAVLTGEDHSLATHGARGVVEGMNIDLERQRVALGVSEADFKLIVGADSQLDQGQWPALTPQGALIRPPIPARKLAILAEPPSSAQH